MPTIPAAAQAGSLHREALEAIVRSSTIGSDADLQLRLMRGKNAGRN
jgi:hypothetical protein